MPRVARATSDMPVIRAVSLVLAHVPSLVRLGSKPLRVLREIEKPIEYLQPHLRDWEAARTYAPNQVFIGNLGVDELAAWPTPWHRNPIAEAGRFGPDGEIMPEDEFLGLLAACDGFDLLALDRDLADRARRALDAHPVVGRESGRPAIRAGVTAGVLDARIVIKEQDGTYSGFDVADLDEDRIGSLTVFEGATSGMISDDDVRLVADEIEPGTAAAMIVYENSWAAPFVAAVRRNGGVLVASERVHAQDLLDALDAVEAAS